MQNTLTGSDCSAKGAIERALITIAWLKSGMSDGEDAAARRVRTRAGDFVHNRDGRS